MSNVIQFPKSQHPALRQYDETRQELLALNLKPEELMIPRHRLRQMLNELEDNRRLTT